MTGFSTYFTSNVSFRDERGIRYTIIFAHRNKPSHRRSPSHGDDRPCAANPIATRPFNRTTYRRPLPLAPQTYASSCEYVLPRYFLANIYFRTNITGFSTLFVPMFFSGRSEILLRKPAAAAAAVAGASSVNVAAAAAAAVEQAVEQHQHQHQHSYTDAAAESFLESVGEINASDVVCKKVSFLFSFSSTR